MKSIIFAGLLLGAAQGAHAAPYLNIEANQGYSGNRLGSTVTDVHYGVEGEEEFIAGIFKVDQAMSLSKAKRVSFNSVARWVLPLLSALLPPSTEKWQVPRPGDPAWGLKAGLKWSF